MRKGDVSNFCYLLKKRTVPFFTLIDAGARPRAFTWNSIQNRVYITNSYGSSVSGLNVFKLNQGEFL